MRVQFLQAAKIKEHHFKLGTHDVSDEVIEDHYFKSLLKAGLVIEPDPHHEVVVVSKQERAKALADKVALRAKPEASEEKVEEILEPVEDEIESKKHKKSKR